MQKINKGTPSEHTFSLGGKLTAEVFKLSVFVVTYVTVFW